MPRGERTDGLERVYIYLYFLMRLTIYLTASGPNSQGANLLQKQPHLHLAF